jgi:hypothetical protein
MKKLLIALLVCGLSYSAEATDYAKRFPTDTALEVVTPASGNSTYLKLDCSNDPLTGDLAIGACTIDVATGGIITTGTLSAGADTDTTHILGRAKIGYDGTSGDYATFAHYDMMALADFALTQDNGGMTYLNSSLNQFIYFCNQGVQYARMDDLEFNLHTLPLKFGAAWGSEDIEIERTDARELTLSSDYGAVEFIVDGNLTTTGTLGAGAITGTSLDAGSGLIQTTGMMSFADARATGTYNSNYILATATTVSGAHGSNPATVNVVSTTGFPSTGWLNIGATYSVKYTGTTATSFTGCSWGLWGEGAYTPVNGDAVKENGMFIVNDAGSAYGDTTGYQVIFGVRARNGTARLKVSANAGDQYFQNTFLYNQGVRGAASGTDYKVSAQGAGELYLYSDSGGVGIGMSTGHSGTAQIELGQALSSAYGITTTGTGTFGLLGINGADPGSSHTVAILTASATNGLYVESNSGNGDYGAYFNDTGASTYVYINDGTYAINATGLSYFAGVNGDSVYLGYLGSGGAVYATDTSSNTVGLADGSYAINATGDIHLDGGDSTLPMTWSINNYFLRITPDGSPAYYGFDFGGEADFGIIPGGQAFFEHTAGQSFMINQYGNSGAANGLLMLGSIIDTSEVTSIDPNNRLLYSDDGSTESIDWTNRELMDGVGNLAVDWNIRELYGDDGSTPYLSWGDGLHTHDGVDSYTGQTEDIDVVIDSDFNTTQLHFVNGLYVGRD